MTSITVVNKGTYGFDVTPLTGVGFSKADATAVRSQVEVSLALGDAIRNALTVARESGLEAFNPADNRVLTLPPDLSDADREYLFATIMGHAYSGGPIRLDQWSQAVSRLDHWAAAAASMLPPGAGGGTRNIGGVWYVNGQAWSLSELFTANRVNTLAEIDKMTAQSLNVIAANNEMAKALTNLMERLFKKYNENDWEGKASKFVSKSWVDSVGTTDQESAVPIAGRDVWTDGSERYPSDEVAELEYAVSFNQLRDLADKYIGPNSLIAKMDGLGSTQPQPSGTGLSKGLQKEDFRAMIDEVETIIGAFSTDNQIAQLRNETLFNSRSNLIEGLSTFLRGQQTTGSTLSRNQ